MDGGFGVQGKCHRRGERHWLAYAHWSRARKVNSVPISHWIVAGSPRVLPTRIRVCATSRSLKCPAASSVTVGAVHTFNLVHEAVYKDNHLSDRG
jgi:hypothetical protein